MSFLVAPQDVQIEEGLATKGAHQPHPRCTFLMWVQTAAREVDGPSLQPSTWH